MNKAIKSIITLLFVGIIMPLLCINLFAEAGYDEDLFNSSNTYNLGVSKNDNYYKFSFDKNNKNNNAVDTNASITFLTHGLSGSAHDYAIDKITNSFGYSEYSIITKLKNKQDSNIYHVEFSAPFKFDIYKLTWSENFAEEKISHITDISKHSIVIFSGYSTTSGNDFIYSQFNMMASYIINDVKNLKSGVLPKVNLIGFSRGGLTNMQYALDHPDIVKSIFSFDTPYFAPIEALINYSIYEDGSGVVENGGIKDLGNNDIYMSYYNRWNDNYELYDDIFVGTIGLYQELPMILYQLLYNSIQMYENQTNQDFIDFFTYIFLTLFSRFFYEAINAAEVTNLISRNLYTDEGKQAVKKFLTELEINKRSSITLYFDGLVDLDAQIGKDNINGYEYKGFDRFVHEITYDDYYIYPYTTRTRMVVTHAIAPYVTEAINYVLSNISMQ